MPPAAPPARFRDGLVAALPIVFGYGPIAFSFGVAATQGGFSVVEAVLFSVVIFAGAAQFLALALVSSGVPLIVAIFTLIAMNLRHLMYGPTILEKAGPEARTRHAWAWAWGLTDEVFGATLGVLARGEVRFSERFMLAVGLASYASWVGGTLVGALAGGGALAAWPSVTAGLGFMLPALFLALLLSILERRQAPVVLVAGLATVAATLLWSPTPGILAGLVIGALAGVLRRRPA